MRHPSFIEFVGHASFIYRAGGISLLSDPWIKGTAFNDSWLPYPQPVLSEEQLAGITHLWISHEHPDHMSIPTLKGLSGEHRARITLLYQEHVSKDVLSFLVKQGFKEVVELPNRRWVRLNSEFEVCCRQVGHLDSCLAMRTSDKVILNANDCEFPERTLKELKRDCGEIDVLLNQFSYAGWAGNPDDMQEKSETARAVLGRFVRDFNALDPKVVVPFASFVRFCHEDNVHMNSNVNTVADVARVIPRGRLAVLYPGEVWNLADAPAPERSIAAYMADLSALSGQPLVETPAKTSQEILDAIRVRVEELRGSYHAPLLRWVPPVRIHVRDLMQDFRLELATGNVEGPIPPNGEWDVLMSSQAAWYSFKLRFGLPTLGVSGRYQLGKNRTPFLRLKKLASACSSGIVTRRPKGERFSFLPPRSVVRALSSRGTDLLTQFLSRLRSV